MDLRHRDCDWNENKKLDFLLIETKRCLVPGPANHWMLRNFR